ncbi:methyltransferase domain-containing protein [Candidatus Ponderosibacter sp. Uisw_141_02]|uniref:class I SAM-dependent methyltransferase n=1 Tax=Candidatus Ponderosibacter sp. Uisw_141_02 TaxID=3231000 RepID=UPI003D406D53
MQKCIICESFLNKSIANLGNLPPSNLYLRSVFDGWVSHPLQVGICSCCGLVQLVEPMSLEIIEPKVNWIKYEEPEDHLDTLAHRLIELLNLSPNSRIAGLTYKDETLLERFKVKGCKDYVSIDPRSDLGISKTCFGLETVQEKINPAQMDFVARNRGKFDVVIGRHILEHARDPNVFVEGCKALLKPNGFLILEVPDNEKVLAHGDHCFVWEEHCSYFTPLTLRRFALRHNFEVLDLQIYPQSFEDLLVVILQNADKHKYCKLGLESTAIDQFVAFSNAFDRNKKRLQTKLRNLIAQDKKLIMVGSGHLAIKFINMHDLQSYFSYIIDDNQLKHRRILPKSNLEIKPSVALLSETNAILFLSLSPASQKSFLQKHKEQIDGLEIYSIFNIPHGI